MRTPSPYIAQWLVGILLLSSLAASAQREANTWYFGEQVGFDFSAGVPKPLLNSRMTTYYASATISDKQTGQVLFYSNGEQVWNRQHRVMPNGDSLAGLRYTAQGALIVPVPGDAQRYYLFTLSPRLRSGLLAFRNGIAYRLYYSLVDMRLQDGQGDVVATDKNTPLAGHLMQKLTAVRQANGRDYWVLVHEWGSDTFLIYGVTAQGVAPPVRQRIGPSQPLQLADTAYVGSTEGQLRASPDGRYLAETTTTNQGDALSNKAEPCNLFAFDAATGLLSYYTNLGLLFDASGLCFSPDNSKLYVSNASRTPDRQNYNIISQYDLLAGDSAAVAASGQSIVVGNPLTNVSDRKYSISTAFHFQNGLDGRIYGASGYAAPGEPPENQHQTFFIIGRPNSRGFACALRYQYFAAFGSRQADGGLPNFMQHYFDGLEPTELPACEPRETVLFPNPTAASFTVQLPGGCHEPYQLRLYNSIGQRIVSYDAPAATGDTPVNISGLAAGLYFVELRFAQKTVTKKVVKY